MGPTAGAAPVETLIDPRELVGGAGRQARAPTPSTRGGPSAPAPLAPRPGREARRWAGTAFQKAAGSPLVLISGPHARYDCLSYPPIDVAPQHREAVDAGTGR